MRVANNNWAQSDRELYNSKGQGKEALVKPSRPQRHLHHNLYPHDVLYNVEKRSWQEEPRQVLCRLCQLFLLTENYKINPSITEGFCFVKSFYEPQMV